MPPTNNHAEQSLRLPVIFRKITFGSQSLRGAQALAVNLSLITTAKRHGRDPLELIKTVPTRPTTPRSTRFTTRTACQKMTPRKRSGIR